jgi:hypothetical protein
LARFEDSSCGQQAGGRFPKENIMALKIIGPGFGRTGTNTLKLALTQLGYGPCHHMFEVRDNPHQVPLWGAAAAGKQADWDEVFKGYASQVDWPGARYWRQLARYYPDAKVILTVRDPEEWYDSVKTTIIPLLSTRGSHADAHLNALLHMAHQTVFEQVFGGMIENRDHAIATFQKHAAEVKSEIPSNRLLVMDVVEGWAPLCNFLHVEIPDDPFPRTNSSKGFADEEWKDAKSGLPA